MEKKEKRNIKVLGCDFRRLDVIKNPVAAIMRWMYTSGGLHYSWEYTVDADGCGVTIRNISVWQLSELVEAVKDAWYKGHHSWNTLTLFTGAVGCKARLEVKASPNDNLLKIAYVARWS